MLRINICYLILLRNCAPCKYSGIKGSKVGCMQNLRVRWSHQFRKNGGGQLKHFCNATTQIATSNLNVQTLNFHNLESLSSKGTKGLKRGKPE